MIIKDIMHNASIGSLYSCQSRRYLDRTLCSIHAHAKATVGKVSFFGKSKNCIQCSANNLSLYKAV